MPLNRSYLFTPGNVPRRVEKALTLDADVVIVDPQETWEIDPSRFRSKSRNTPFAGWKVKGRVKTTLLSGRVVYESSESANRSS